MSRFRQRGLAVLLSVFALTGTAAGSTATAAPVAHATTQSSVATPAANKPKPDCPAGLSCAFEPTTFVNATTRGDGTCTWTPIGKPNTKRPVFGIVHHTTEGSLQAALSESRDAANCVSWNFLIGPKQVYQSVPLNGVAYDSANRYFNSDYLQIEIIGHAGLCDVTATQFKMLEKLDRYLVKRFHITPNYATILGHDNVPGITDARQATQHWDPGVCFNWNALLKSLGAKAPKRAGLNAQVVTIAPVFSKNHQPVSACTEGSQCDPSKVHGTNFVTLYSGPSTKLPLTSDPYLHPDGTPGTTAMNDWGDKAPTMHQYVVAVRLHGWIGIWFGGSIAYFQNAGHDVINSHATVVVPKHTSVTVYGRPMPSSAEFDASPIPDDVWPSQDLSAALTQYRFTTGQSYVLANAPVVNTFYEGCDKTNCTGLLADPSNPKSLSGDGAVVCGKTKYLEIDYNHRMAFVKASGVTVRHV